VATFLRPAQLLWSELGVKVADSYHGADDVLSDAGRLAVSKGGEQNSLNRRVGPCR
jgi:hypothetical protein